MDYAPLSLPDKLMVLRWSLLLCVLAVLLAVVAASLRYRNDTAARLHREAQAQRDTASAKLAHADIDRRTLGETIARYRELAATGRFATENQARWIDTLQRIRTERHLLGLDYAIAPPRPLEAGPSGSAGLAFLVSTLRIDLPLLHENDLLGLLADLSAQGTALVSVKSCTLERGAGIDPTLHARCAIDLISWQERP